MRSAWIVLHLAACQPLVSIDVDPRVEWLAILTLDENGEVTSATGLIRVGAELPRQPNEGRGLLLGFSADQIDPSEPRLAEAVALASPCDPALTPIWIRERSEDRYVERPADGTIGVTAPWMPPKCESDRVCLKGRCVDAVVDIDAGRDAACAKWASGRISCWGHNDWGQTGRPEREIEMVSEAQEVSGIEAVDVLAVGEQTACVLSRGSPICWGYDHRGEVLGAVAQPLGRPRPIEGIEDAVAIAVGFGHTCVIERGGEVRCWGRNDSGQLGDQSTTWSADPVTVIGVEDAVEIGAGESHTCARTAAGSVLCFGDNARGQLGVGLGKLVEPIRAGALAIDVGLNHSCAILEGGTLSCWGDNRFHQLGGGDVSIAAPGIAVDLGSETSCALEEGGAIECWGAADRGALGRLEPFPFVVTFPIASPLEVPAIDVAAGGFFTCALDVERNVWCWGHNGRGELGNGRDGIAHERELALEREVVKLAAGEEMTCALLVGGEVQCWGNNIEAELGRGSRSVVEGPGLVALPGRAIDVDAGTQHACAILEGGDVYCWGWNAYRQVSPSSVTAVETAERVLRGAIDLALGDYHSCAILSSGEVHCWGATFNGATGHGGMIPAPVPGISDAIDGDAGFDQTCVRKRDNTLACWGRYANLDGFTADEIAVGRSHSCARRGGDVYCFGGNDHGELGDGTRIAHDRPMPVLGVSDARKLVIGSSHACAVVGDRGELWCWGDNLFDQLNDGNAPIDRATPAPIDGLEGVILGDAFRHSCVYLETGDVRCWGANEWGQVNVERAPIELVPSRVRGLEPI